MIKHTGNLASLLAAGLFLGAGLAGCTQQQTTKTGDTAAKPETAPQSASVWGHYRPQLKDGEASAMMAFPTGEVGTSAILLHQVMPKQVRRGEDFGYSYHVTNLTSADLQNVVVMLESSNNLAIKASSPEGSTAGSGMAWTLGSLAGGETKVINVTGNAGQVGTASDCITVSYNNFLCATTSVVEPALALTKTATATALRCDDIVLRYVVKNTGSGPAADVVITDTLPVGLTMSDGSRDVRIPVGTLAAGESKAYEVKAEANNTGTFESPAAAVASGDLRAAAEKTSTVVTAPSLEISSECGEGQFLGRNFTHTYTVKNNGNGVANATVASISIPAGSSVVRSTDGGVVQGSNVVWDLGALAAGQSRSFGVTLSGPNAQGYSTTGTVNAECADTVTDTCSTQIRGIPAVLLEVIDQVDPVEVGQQTTYVITVTNQGSAPDRNVRIVITLPDQQSLVSTGGATSGSAAGKTITFAPLPVLGVGEVKSWTVTVKADAEGDVRFRTEMTSDNLTSPVTETEATNLYK